MNDPKRQAPLGIGIDVRAYSIAVQDTQGSGSLLGFDLAFPEGTPRNIERLATEVGADQFADEVFAAAAASITDDTRIVVAVPEHWRHDSPSLPHYIQQAVSKKLPNTRIVSTGEAALTCVIERSYSGAPLPDPANVLVCVAGDTMVELVAFEVRQGRYYLAAYANSGPGTGEWDYDLAIGRSIASTLHGPTSDKEATNHAQRFRHARQAFQEWWSPALLQAAEKFPSTEAFANRMGPPRPTLGQLMTNFDSLDRAIGMAINSVCSGLTWHDGYVCLVGQFSWHPAIPFLLEKYVANAGLRLTWISGMLDKSELSSAGALGAALLAGKEREVSPQFSLPITMPYCAIRNGELVEAEMSFGGASSLYMDGFRPAFLSDDRQQDATEVMIEPNRPLTIRIGDKNVDVTFATPIAGGPYRVGIILHPTGSASLVFDDKQSPPVFVHNLPLLEATNG